MIKWIKNIYKKYEDKKLEELNKEFIRILKEDKCKFKKEKWNPKYKK